MGSSNRQKSQRLPSLPLLGIPQEHQLISPKIYAENLSQTSTAPWSLQAPMSPGQLILWAVVWCLWPIWSLQSSLHLLCRIPRAPPNVWLWDSASGPISCLMKSLVSLVMILLGSTGLPENTLQTGQTIQICVFYSLIRLETHFYF